MLSTPLINLRLLSLSVICAGILNLFEGSCLLQFWIIAFSEIVPKYICRLYMGFLWLRKSSNYHRNGKAAQHLNVDVVSMVNKFFFLNTSGNVRL